MMTVLSQAFITPIEREDLVALSNYLDDITDAVEDVFLQIYMCNVDTIREDVPQMVELLLECIKALQDVIGELKRFKSSKTIGQSIIRVNDLEEQGDRLYVENMHRLYGGRVEKHICLHRELYGCVRACGGYCEHSDHEKFIG